MPRNRKTTKPSLTKPKKSNRRLVKRKKPSHDVFNKVYMDEILEKYEQFVEKLLSKNIHYNIIPKQYQRECYSKSFGDVFSRTPDNTFRKTFGDAFKSNDHLNQHLAQTGNNHVAFETMFDYELITPWWTQLLSHNANNVVMHNILLSELERLKNYNDGEGKNYEKDLRRTTLLNHFRIFQLHWELIYWKYSAISYKYVAENFVASDDAKRKFREIDLTSKDQYIKALEDILQWKEKEPTEKMTMFQKRYQEEQLELSELRNQRNSLIREIKEQGGDKAINYQDHTFTGECMVDENERLSEIETKAITDLIPIQFNLHAQRDEILSLENSISQLHDSILTRLVANKETASLQQVEVHNQLRYLLTLDMPMEEQLGKLALDFKNSRNSSIDSAIYDTTNIDMWIKTITTTGFAKRNKDKEQQESKIDQLEMKIIRHIIDTTTESDSEKHNVQDVENQRHNTNEIDKLTEFAKHNDKRMDKLEENSTHIDTISNISSDVQHELPESKYKKDLEREEKELKDFGEAYRSILNECVPAFQEKSKLEEQNKEWKIQLKKVHEKKRKWLKKKTLDKEDLEQHEKDIDFLVNESLNLSSEETQSDEEKNHTKKALHQTRLLLADLKLELAQVDVNLKDVLDKVSIKLHNVQMFLCELIV